MILPVMKCLHYKAPGQNDREKWHAEYWTGFLFFYAFSGGIFLREFTERAETVRH